MPKPGGEGAPSCAVRNENARGPHHRIDDISRTQRKLLDAAIDPRTNGGLVQIDLRFSLRGLCACLLRRKKRGHADGRGLFRRRCRIQPALAAREQHLELFDITLRDDAGVAFLQLALHVQFVRRLLIVALGLRDLSLRLENIGLCGQHGGIDFGNLAPSRFQGGFLL